MSALESTSLSAAETPQVRPFTPGVSGNPHGRPKGSRNKPTRLVEGLLDDQAENGDSPRR
jgi:Family of unknown function (DUF5681)